LSLQTERAATDRIDRFASYRGKPVEYIRDVLGQRLWSSQKAMARAVAAGGKVMGRASHTVGKTHLAACLTSYWFDVYPESCAVITTAPTRRDVVDLLWREVRLQRGRAGLGGFVGKNAPELFDNPDHFAKGMTAEKGESFQGRHLQNMLFIFDEAIGIDSIFWESTNSMYDPAGNHAWFVIGNPTDTSSRMYDEEMSGRGWNVFEMSSLEHPNVRLQLRGRPPVFPLAVKLGTFEGWMRDYGCEAISAGDAQKGIDLEWPPRSGVWYRTSPDMDARALGRWPTQATYSVWSNAAWNAAVRKGLAALFPGPTDLPEIGADIARFGNDFFEIVARWGPCAIHHERHNGWEGPKIVGRLKELAREMAARATATHPSGRAPVRAQEIKIKVDADGMGGLGVVDWSGDYRFIGVSAATNAIQPDRYHRLRDELWFQTVGRAKTGGVDLSRLGEKSLALLRRQALAPRYTLDGSGRRVVESKEQLKKRIPGIGSPDGMDALNLAFWAPRTQFTPELVETNEEHWLKRITPGAGPSAQERRPMFGRKR
jgi:hypothetical protein